MFGPSQKREDDDDDKLNKEPTCLQLDDLLTCVLPIIGHSGIMALRFNSSPAEENLTNNSNLILITISAPAQSTSNPPAANEERAGAWLRIKIINSDNLQTIVIRNQYKMVNSDYKCFPIVRKGILILRATNFRINYVTIK